MLETKPETVTIVARRKVKRGQEAAYEAALSDLLDEAGSMSGYVGADIHRPQAAGQAYVSVFRFTSPETLDAFERSEMRRRFLARIVPYVETEAIWERLSGLEVWFDPPPGTIAPQPVRWKMALVLIVVVTALVELLATGVTALLPGLPSFTTTLLIVTLQVLLLTYLLMPLITRRLAWWLFPHS